MVPMRLWSSQACVRSVLFIISCSMLSDIVMVKRILKMLDTSSILLPHLPYYLIQGGSPTFITGGRAIVLPCIQNVLRIPLNTMTLEVRSPRVYTMQGVPLSVIGTAQVRLLIGQPVVILASDWSVMCHS